jgi:DNA invertase Pin-like site-specific DNA recombinase
MILQMGGAFTEFERAILRERTKAGWRRPAPHERNQTCAASTVDP